MSGHSNDDPPSSNGKPRQVRSKTLTEVLNGVETITPLPASLEIRQIVCDSRKVQPGAIFFALRGAKENGQAFIANAIQRGAVAVAVVSDEPLTGVIPPGVIAVQVREARKALAIASANFYDHPGNALQLAAVTGTNGKTTTTSVIDATYRDVTEPSSGRGNPIPTVRRAASSPRTAQPSISRWRDRTPEAASTSLAPLYQDPVKLLRRAGQLSSSTGKSVGLQQVRHHIDICAGAEAAGFVLRHRALHCIEEILHALPAP